jgi:hypothetical protein
MMSIDREERYARGEEPTPSGSIEYNDIIGEPCAVKVACTVRGGTVGKGLKHSTSLAVYSTRDTA